MEAFSSSKLLIIILSFSFAIHFSSQLAEAEKPYQEASTKFIRTSCSTTTYPRLCYASLVKHASYIRKNRLILTGTALNVALASAKSTSAMMSSLSKNHTNGLRPREVAAMRDCVEELRDSVDELRQCISEMGRVRRSNFDMTMSDVQTWVSSALTDETTCTDGFQGAAVDGEVKTAVRGQIVKVAQLTSNALALINQLASVHG